MPTSLQAILGVQCRSGWSLSLAKPFQSRHSFLKISYRGQVGPTQRRLRYPFVILSPLEYALEADSEYHRKEEVVTRGMHPGISIRYSSLYLRLGMGRIQISGKGGTKYSMNVQWKEEKKALEAFDIPNDTYLEEDPDDIPDEGEGDIATSSSKISDATMDTIARMDHRRINFDLIEQLIHYICDVFHGRDGSILVFLPGIAEIRRLYGILQEEAMHDNQYPSLHVLPLHGSLSASEQSAVFEPAPAGQLKVVLSTNVAETGITIPDALFVIDTCRAREVRYCSIG
jgi:superfamily II DNA or RNA helicase